MFYRAWKGTMLITKQCKRCGKDMKVKPSRMDRSQYCSRQCANEGRKGISASPATQFYKGMQGTRWNGGVTYGKGYRFVRQADHPRANSNGYVAEHILIWEQNNGGPLPDGWCVHHFNGIKDDNRPENLIGMPRKNHHPALDPGYIKEQLREVEKERDEWKYKYQELLAEKRNTKRPAILLCRDNS